ncbi:MAG: hypothetical protein K0Q57_312 [Gammaproteobacteria bacterium]|nr:hypothetical protein [Gammaproteobacteria bacterium]
MLIFLKQFVKFILNLYKSQLIGMGKKLKSRIISLVGPGIICYKLTCSTKLRHAFATQIYFNKRLFNSFSSNERLFIEKTANFEKQDLWYKTACELLEKNGIDEFL